MVLVAVGMNIATSWEAMWCKLVDISQTAATAIMHEYPVDAKTGRIFRNVGMLLTTCCHNPRDRNLHITTFLQVKIFGMQPKVITS